MKIKTNRHEKTFETDFLEIYIGEKKFRIEVEPKPKGSNNLLITKSNFDDGNSISIRPVVSNQIEVS